MERRDIVVADLEELDKVDASVIHPRRINAKDVLTPQSWDEFIFAIPDGTAKFSGRYQEFREPTLRPHRHVWSEKTSAKDFNRQKQTQQEYQNLQASGNCCKVLSQMLCKVVLKP